MQRAFLIDVVSGISELLVVCSNFTGKEVAEISCSDLWSFYEQSESQHAEAKLIKEYLLLYGLCLIGLLQGQKFGNHKLSLAMTK